eukprot:Colp12_sorted_trinity150504_noHs@14173
MVRQCKVVVVGSGGVGKSCVTTRFVRDKYSEYYDPTIEESYRKKVELDGDSWDMEIVDTAGQEEFSSFRDSTFSMGDGFLLVFSITSASSWKELQDLRDKILRHKDIEAAPMVIVGNKKDLAQDRTVTTEEAELFCKQVNCPYFETSAKTGENVEQSMHEVLRQIKAMTPEPEKTTKDKGKKKKCVIL